MPEFYSKLLELRRAEAASRGLAKIPADFYPLARSYLAEVRQTFESELRENPSGQKGEVARQTHARASQVARDLVDARTMKVLSAAFQAAAGGNRELPSALAEERAFFDRIVEAVHQFRAGSAPYLEPAPGRVVPGTAGASASPPAPPRTAASPVPAPRAGPAPVMIRMLKGSPPVAFGGETLELRAEDVLTVSPDLARILVEGKAAERLRVEPPGPGTA